MFASLPLVPWKRSSNASDILVNSIFSTNSQTHPPNPSLKCGTNRLCNKSNDFSFSATGETKQIPLYIAIIIIKIKSYPHVTLKTSQMTVCRRHLNLKTKPLEFKRIITNTTDDFHEKTENEIFSAAV